MATVMPARKNFGGYGAIGKKIALRSNFFQVKISQKTPIYHYDVEVHTVPDTSRDLPKKLCEKVAQQFIKKYNHSIFKDNFVAYDGRKNIFTSKKIAGSIIPENTRKSFEIDYQKPDNNRSETFEVRLKFAQEIPLGKFQKSMKKNSKNCNQDFETSLIAFQALDVILAHGFKINDSYTSIGRNFFLKQQQKARDLGNGKEIWFGFHQSLRECESSMMLNVDVAASTFYKNQPLLDYVHQVLYPVKRFVRGDRPAPKSTLHNLNDRQKREIEKELKMMKVETTIGTQRSYRIYKLARETAKTCCFDTDSGKISVYDYFLKRYNYRILHPDLPLVWVNPKEKNTKIPLEICYVTGGEHYRKKLDPSATSEMVKCCAKPAPERAEIINSYVKNNGYDQSETVKGFGLSVDLRMAEFEGRVLPARKMLTKSGKMDVVTFPERGGWIQKSNFYQAKHIKKWTLFCTEQARFLDESVIKEFVSKIQKGGRDVGMSIAPPIAPKYLTSTNEVDRAMQEAKRNGCEIVMFILGNQNDQFYSKIKQFGDVKVKDGLRTQCITGNNVKRANKQLIGNLLLKINAKMCGTNSIVNDPNGTVLFKTPTIVIGADVTHPAPGDNEKPSIAAICASLDANATTYHAAVRVQAHRQETIGSKYSTKSAHLKDMVGECLTKFLVNTKGQKPAHIIYYRDGISEGQFAPVLEDELTQIRQACHAKHESYKPKITFIVVTKRHHTRLFCKNTRDAEGKAGNVPAGTVVDRVIVHPEWNDFYLCSHNGIQGTSKPAKYTVLYNDFEEFKKSPDVLQSLTYSLCHLHQRCQKSVSIPAPVYAAHLSAYRATLHVDADTVNYVGEMGDVDAKSIQEKVRPALTNHFV